ncbi:MAG: MFS transporter [Spirochaetales bacterium]|nr:MFS transporter [Spirochaetales bacterium]
MNSIPGQEKAFPWKFVLPLYLGSTLNPINSSLIATALVPIAADLHVSVGSTAALVAAVYLASAIGQPVAGKLSEVFGPRRIFAIGIIFILLAGLIGGLGHSFAAIVLARVFIGLGSSSAYPSAMLLIKRRATLTGLLQPPGGVLGGLAITGMAVAAVGLPLGGLIVGSAGWRGTFLINIPVAVVAFVLTYLWLPQDEPVKVKGGFRELMSSVDVGGILLFGASITSLLSFLLSFPQFQGITLGTAVIGLIGFIFWELRAAHPFIDLRILASNLALTRTYLRFALSGLVVYGVMYGASQWFEAGRHLTPEQTGLALLPMAVIAPLISFPVSRRNLVRGPLVLTGITLILGSVGLLLLDSQSSIFLIALVTLVFGMSMGLFTVGNQTALYSQAPENQIGTAAGLMRTFGYLGSIGSSALTGIVFESKVDDAGLHTIATILIAVSVLVLLLTIADRKLAFPKPVPILEKQQ